MYHFSELADGSFDGAIAQVTEVLQQEGMGVLTEVDGQSAFNKKLGDDSPSPNQILMFSRVIMNFK